MSAAKIGKRGQKIAPEKKNEALAWLKANPERGNLRKASEQFGISYVTLSKWASDAGLGKKAAKKSTKKSSKTPENFGGVVEFQGGLFIDAKNRKALAKAMESFAQAFETLKQAMKVT